MTDERMIAAKEWIDNLLGGNGFGSDYTSDELNTWAAELVAVFEKAHTPHTPTDDEREAEYLCDTCGECVPCSCATESKAGSEREAARALRDIGAEVPEPSAPMSLADDWADLELHGVPLEPQGEPSDAQALEGLVTRAQSIVNSMKSSAGRRTRGDEWCYVRFGQVESLDVVLAALRAASEIGGEQ